MSAILMLYHCRQQKAIEPETLGLKIVFKDFSSY